MYSLDAMLEAAKEEVMTKSAMEEMTNYNHLYKLYNDYFDYTDVLFYRNASFVYASLAALISEHLLIGRFYPDEMNNVFGIGGLIVTGGIALFGYYSHAVARKMRNEIDMSIEGYASFKKKINKLLGPFREVRLKLFDRFRGDRKLYEEFLNDDFYKIPMTPTDIMIENYKKALLE